MRRSSAAAAARAAAAASASARNTSYFPGTYVPAALAASTAASSSASSATRLAVLRSLRSARANARSSSASAADLRSSSTNSSRGVCLLRSMRAARLRSFVALARSARAASRRSPPSATVHRTCASLKSRAMRTSRMVTPVSSKRWCMVGWVMTAHRALRRRTPARICAMSWPSALRIWGWPAKYSRVGERRRRVGVGGVRVQGAQHEGIAPGGFGIGASARRLARAAPSARRAIVDMTNLPRRRTRSRAGEVSVQPAVDDASRFNLARSSTCSATCTTLTDVFYRLDSPAPPRALHAAPRWRAPTRARAPRSRTRPATPRRTAMRSRASAGA